jgi:hypothetical protein
VRIVIRNVPAEWQALRRFDQPVEVGLDSLLTSAREAVVIGVCQFKGYI